MKIERGLKLGDVGIRLKPNEPNLLENYTRFRKQTRRKKKRKKKKKKTMKRIEIHRKKDPFSQIIEEQTTPDKVKVKEEVKEEVKKEEVKKEEVKDAVKDAVKEEVKDAVKDKAKEEVKEAEVKDEVKVKDTKPEIKKVKVQNRPQDLSESDPNVKKLVITASVEPDKKKKGSQIKLE